jgi:protein-L-isoaspartate(D-aspartate) O-methyltransferase
VEIDPALKDLAQTNLAANGIANVEVVLGDGIQLAGAQAGNYDVIVVSGSVPVVPDALLAQIKVGGRMFIIVGSLPAMTAQIITRTSDVEYSTVGLFETIAKPLRNVPTPSRFKF